MTFVDTHIHLEYIMTKSKLTFEKLEEKYLSHKQLDACICSFCDCQGLSEGFGMYEQILSSPKVYGAFGLHPHNAKYYNERIEERILKLVQHEKCVAFGEFGLDYFKNISPVDVQMQVFERQMKLAIDSKKPILIHSRAAEKDTMAVLKKYASKDTKIHLHCFTDSSKFALELLKDFQNLYFGFTGVITYKNTQNLQKCIADDIPIERILFETDGPYMPPEGSKAKVAIPMHVQDVAQKVSELKNLKVEDVYQQVRKNTFEIYGI